MLVSIAMCTYNGARFLKEQLDSLIYQTHQELEIVIVDDASTDTTWQILSEYAKKYPFIHLHQNPQNLGVCQSFNKAMSLCRGEYIALCDQDDVWFDNKVEVLLNQIGDSFLIHSDAILVNENLIPIAHSYFSYSKNRYTAFADLLRGNNATGCCMMISRAFASLVLPIPMGFYIHDHYLSLLAAFYGKIKLYDEPLLYYRQHSLNTIGAGRSSFELLQNNAKDKANSYALLLQIPSFKANPDLQFFYNYYSSIYHKKWLGFKNVFRLFNYKHSVKLLGAYIILTGVLGNKFSKWVFNLLRKYKFI